MAPPNYKLQIKRISSPPHQYTNDIRDRGQTFAILKDFYGFVISSKFYWHKSNEYLFILLLYDDGDRMFYSDTQHALDHKSTLNLPLPSTIRSYLL